MTTIYNGDKAITYSFPLDKWQEDAIAAIHREENVLVTAKTGSGKTLVGEYQIAYSLRKGKRVFYTTPIKSLTNQKYHDLKKLFPAASVGIMTGDIKSNPEAQIVVMTTEILRNLMFKQNTSTAHIGTAGQLSGTDLDAVIFDEVHYINDPDRGHVWEETLILLPPTTHLILLSATIDSAPQFAAWLTKAKGVPCNLLQTTHRIVPLIHGIYDSTQGPLPLKALKDGDESAYNPSNYVSFLKSRLQTTKEHEKWQRTVAAAAKTGDTVAGSSHKVKPVSFVHQLNECIDTLKTRDLLPALFFTFSRKECERYAGDVKHTLIDTSEASAVRHMMDFHLHRHEEQLKNLPQYHQIRALLERGIGFHHSGLLPLLKEIVELLFSRGYVKILFCTETFAVGLNMPTRTAVFLDLKKPSDNGFRPLRPDEYIQMAGRAGRRGKDKQGIVLYLPSRNPVDAEDMYGILSGMLQPLTSRLQFHYDFILKAIHANTKTEATEATIPLWESVVNNSFWNAQQEAAANAVLSRIEALTKEVNALSLTPAQETDLKEQSDLQESVKSATNASKKKLQQALNHWNERHMGPVWKAAALTFARKQQLQKQCAALNDEYAYYKQPHAIRVEPVLAALRDWSAITESNTLTPFGVLATEVNEGNSLLMAKLYDSKVLSTATEEEIVACLGAFIVDKEALSKSSHPNELPLTPLVKSTLLQVDEWGHQGTMIDRRHTVLSPEGYWSLATLWVQIAIDWLAGCPAAALATKYEIYEGNLMRGLHKLTNLVNEWNAMATIVGDVDMLAKLEATPAKLTRDIAIPESLYLRL